MLSRLLEEAGYVPMTSPPPAPRAHRLPSALANDIQSLYRKLGGRGGLELLRPGAWDLAFHDMVVELDEELHFNRYRRTTLDPEWTALLPWREPYRELCLVHEVDCLAAGRWGSRWTNASCEAGFGAGDPPGELEREGAPRWKQRALYDAIKDAWCLAGTGVRLARVATHDVIARVCLGDVIEGRATVAIDEVRSFVDSRTAPGRQ